MQPRGDIAIKVAGAGKAAATYALRVEDHGPLDVEPRVHVGGVAIGGGGGGDGGGARARGEVRSMCTAARTRAHKGVLLPNS